MQLQAATQPRDRATLQLKSKLENSLGGRDGTFCNWQLNAVSQLVSQSLRGINTLPKRAQPVSAGTEVNVKAKVLSSKT
eukprot:234762-Chlamydomonas_euryale.AAC.5